MQPTLGPFEYHSDELKKLGISLSPETTTSTATTISRQHSAAITDPATNPTLITTRREPSKAH
ncbi:hypothetical protein HETIRDRAFT_451710 [Heterobasidion irregulare TC 32-1]|uniref:Uncharacterized protein n=1 Tax=Heterobasidion irregulare (strain TC 32-1) TaxID=747525 RepID=W4K9S5_HETIT|nr:uncharacterized protein HETIRDRAFT_451710 [Heterobasidion irregulare TC 32-1]ETW82100.1 hypothetical protein HETIRDRAFT_451710 [Heterobasidion irregulare TC 32-1]